MINVLIWLIVGAIVGWLAGNVTGDQEATLLKIILGMGGAVIVGLGFNRFNVDGPNTHPDDFSVSSLLVSIIGASVLLGIVKLCRR